MRLIQWERANSKSDVFPRTPFEIVLPVYNEQQTLVPAVEALFDYSVRWGEAFLGLRIVDNGSEDQTWKIAGGLAARWPKIKCQQVPVGGRGAALLGAWGASSAEVSLYMDVDLSTHLRHVEDLLHWMDLGYDVVVGSRVHGESRVSRSASRTLLSWFYRQWVQFLFAPKSFDDPQCGFKAVRLSAIRRLLPRLSMTSWFLDTELLVLAERSGLRVRSIPVEWREARGSRVAIVSSVFQALTDLLRIRIRQGL